MRQPHLRRAAAELIWGARSATLVRQAQGKGGHWSSSPSAGSAAGQRVWSDRTCCGQCRHSDSDTVLMPNDLVLCSCGQGQGDPRPTVTHLIKSSPPLRTLTQAYRGSGWGGVPGRWTGGAISLEWCAVGLWKSPGARPLQHPADAGGGRVAQAPCGRLTERQTATPPTVAARQGNGWSRRSPWPLCASGLAASLWTCCGPAPGLPKTEQWRCSKPPAGPRTRQRSSLRRSILPGGRAPTQRPPAALWQRRCGSELPTQLPAPSRDLRQRAIKP